MTLALAVGACGASNTAVGDPAAHGLAVHAGDLRDYLIAVPSGATERVPTIGQNGSVTMSEDASADGTPSKRTDTLERFGFRAEAVRDWTTAAGDGEVVLIQFSSPANALEYITSEQSYGNDLTNWKIPQIAGALVFTDPTFSTATTVQVEGLASEGDTAIIVFTDEPGPATPDLATRLTTDQFLRLAAPPESQPAQS